MKQVRQPERPVDVGREPINSHEEPEAGNLHIRVCEYELKKCLLREVFARPGSRVVKRRGMLLLKHGRFEFSAEALCAARRRRR